VDLSKMLGYVSSNDDEKTLYRYDDRRLLR
jgi:hypothetical protein